MSTSVGAGRAGRRAPAAGARAWPAVAGGLLAGLVLVGSFVYPLVVEPLFNSFTPLPDGALRSQILRLADREGVHVDDVLVADASRRTTTLNAYVSGFGSTRRVVALRQPRPRPARRPGAVGGRPRARARPARRRRHRLAAGCGRGAGRASGCSASRSARSAGAGRWGTRRWCRWCWRCSRSARCWPARSQNAVSRQIETRADVDALRATHDPDGVHPDAARAGGARAGRPDTAGVVPVLVRQPPDHAHPGRDRTHALPGGVAAPRVPRIR